MTDYRHVHFDSALCSDESINVWDLAKPGRIKVLAGHTGTIHSLCIYGDVLYSGDAEKTIFAWDILTLEKQHSFVAADDIVSAICCSPKRIFAATFATIRVCLLV
jgi:WD40 repeat protein